MWIQPSSARWSVALLSTLLASFAISARAQTPESQPISLESEVVAVRAENGAIRDQLRKLEEQQQLLLQVVGRLQQQLDGRSPTDTPPSSPLPQTQATASAIPAPPGETAETTSNPSPAAQPASTSGQPESFLAPQTNADRYRDGMVIWETPEDAKVPFLLKFNINTQLRYLNTIDTFGSFTDHLGVTHDVHLRRLRF